MFSMIIEATPADAERAAEALRRASCPDPNHDGPCNVPWSLMTCRFEDLDEDEQQGWRETFDDER